MKRQPNDITKISHNVKLSFRLLDGKFVALILVFLFASGAVVNHFYHLQILQHDVLAAKAANQQYMTHTESPRRGMILDRNGYPLVLSTYVYRVGMTPRDVATRAKSISDEDIVEKMKQHLGLDDESCALTLEQIKTDRVTGWMGLKKHLAGHNPVPYIAIASEVPEIEAMALKDWLAVNGVGGIRFDAEERRVYNNGNLGSPLLGMTQLVDGKLIGVSGLEASYDALLSGEPGYTFAKRNNYTTKGVIPFSSPVSRPVEKSHHLVSTLDLEFQSILQEELLTAASAAGLTRGVNGLVMEVKTGNVVAMAQLAPFDASDPTALPLGFTEEHWGALSSDEKTNYLIANLWKNTNITDVYEPGSVFKAITLAIGLEENVAWEQTIFHDDPIKIQGEEISCYTRQGHGDETLRQAFYLSCNPVFVQLGERVGQDLYYDWIRKLGFYGRTGIDLPAEAVGLLHAKPMPIDFANLTFGESSSLTAIQLAQFFATVGNGGYMVTPRLGCAATEDGIDVMESFPLNESPQMFSNDTCARVRLMLRDVVRQGTASGTFGGIGLKIGGKTGTAIDASDDERRTFSFVGLVPYDEPEYVVLVSIHKPETSITLSTSAARAANRIAARILNTRGVKQNYSQEELSYLSRTVELPDFSTMKIRDAALQLIMLDLAPCVPTDQFYLDQPCVSISPASGSHVGRGSTVWLYPDKANEVEWVAVPDFQGRNYHECVWLAAEYGVTIAPVGTPQGPSLAQDIAPTSSRALAAVDKETGSPSSAGDSELDASGKVRRGQVVKVYFTQVPQSGAETGQGGDH